MNAAFTLGAGSFASSVTLGAAYGYSMMWVPLYSFTFGIFFLALAARFVCQSETPIIEAQNRYHGKFFGTFATSLLAGCIASVVFNFGQYALGADAIINMFAAFDIHISKGLCCLILLAVSVPLSLMYGSGENPKGVKIVENAIKVMIGIMLIVFIAVVCVISQFIVLLGPRWVSAEFLLLSTGPLLYIISPIPVFSHFFVHLLS